MTESTSEIVANYDNTVDFVSAKFHFKKTKTEETGEEYKRPTVEMEKLPVPSVEGVIQILQAGGKQLDLLMEAVQNIILDRARELVNEKEDINADNFPYAELAWEKIATLPKAERRGGGISKETWEEFGKDYITVMPGITGKDAEKIGNAARLLTTKFNAVKTNKQVIGYLRDQLALYINGSPNAETYKDCVDFLDAKAQLLLAADDAQLLANL